MKNSLLVVSCGLLAALAPVFLAVNQDVPAGSGYKQAVLLVSLAAFGLVLGQFWLSRLWPRRAPGIGPAATLRWHKAAGYIVCCFLLIHPVLMIARRFWVLESDPADNLIIMLRAPAMLPAIISWSLLLLLVILSLARRRFDPRHWRMLHGVLSATFAGLATWHVVAVGRHSNAVMSVYWIVVTAAAIGVLLRSYLPTRTPGATEIAQGVTHELA